MEFYAKSMFGHDLRPWNFVKDFINGRAVKNEDFRKFRAKTGYGRDFRIVSPLQKVDNFTEQCWVTEW